MPHISRDVGTFSLTSTSTASALMPSAALGKIDDAINLTIFFASSASALTSATIIQIAQFDPNDTLQQPGQTQSTAWYNVSSSNVYSSGAAVSLTNISFRGVRVQLAASGSSAELNEPFAYVTKQISV